MDMGVKGFSISVLLWMAATTAEARSFAEDEGTIEESIPTCFLDLLSSTYSNPDNKLHTFNLTTTLDGNVLCISEQPFDPSTVSDFVTCGNKVIHVRTGFADVAKTGKGYDRIRIRCSSTHPLTFESDKPLPFAGIQVIFSKRVTPDSTIIHEVSAKFPRALGVKNDGLEVFSGVYTFWRGTPWNTNFTLNVSSICANETKVSKELCIRIYDNQMGCTIGHSNTDLYFVNVGGSNPTETELRRPCLDHAVQNTCGDKLPGTNCVRNRYCKKILPIHPNGLARCASDGLTKDVEYFLDIYALTQINMSKMWDESLLIRIEEENNSPRFEVKYQKENSTLEAEYADDGSNDTLLGDYYEEDNSSSTVETGTEDSNGDFQFFSGSSSCKQFTAILSVESQKTLALYDEGFFQLECHFIEYFLVKPVIWHAGWTNGSTTPIFRDYGENFTDEVKFVLNEGEEAQVVEVKIKSSHIQFQALHGMQNVSCEMYYWNSSSKARNVQDVVVQDSKAPLFSTNRVAHTVETGETLILECLEENAAPEPEYRWVFEGKIMDGFEALEKDHTSRSHKSVLSIPKVTASDQGEYICISTNFRGSAKKVFDVTVHDGTRDLLLALGITLLVLLVLVVVAIVSFYKMRLKYRARLSKAEIREFMTGNSTALVENDYAHKNARNMAFKKEFELHWCQFQLSPTQLGSGVHGVVYKGTIGELPVAVKTVREGVEKEVLKALLDELKIMMYLEKNEYIVEFKGACTELLGQGRLYVLVEFCSLGSLEGFLHANKINFVQDSGMQYVNTGGASKEGGVVGVEQFGLKDIIQWSLQIAKGMRYLEEKKVIHGDLAIRNVLMKSMDHVKITDFGLSRQLVNTDTYVKKHQALLPWRYLAIEALREFRFTSKSDVWSYGVTVWEILTMGAVPYPGVAWSPAFLQLLEDNMRLYKPKIATAEIYDILTACWEPEPESRPSFAELEMLMSKVSS